MLIDEMGGPLIRVSEMAQKILDAGYDDYTIYCGADEKEHTNDFRDAGLLWWVNTQLHLFGYAIVFDGEKKEDGSFKINSVYPTKVKFRGFTEDCNDRGYRRLTQYLKGFFNDDVLKN
jgi:hypothetical protein